MTAMNQEEIVSSTRTVMQGLEALKAEHNQVPYRHPPPNNARLLYCPGLTNTKRRKTKLKFLEVK